MIILLVVIRNISNLKFIAYISNAHKETQRKWWGPLGLWLRRFNVLGLQARRLTGLKPFLTFSLFAPNVSMDGAVWMDKAV